ncbi:MAG: hypothetical protein LRY71_06150 [Bacillaceae bacterium]|nr:hypothetical protein [Bacillaceae bacterium]
MAWYSYFFLNLPEAFFMLATAFAVLGIAWKSNKNSMFLFSILYGGIAFSVSIFIQNSFKPLLTLISFFLLVIILFRFSIIKSFIICIIAFLSVSIFEIILFLPIIQLSSFTFEQIQESPLLRILAGIFTIQAPLLLTILVH